MTILKFLFRFFTFANVALVMLPGSERFAPYNLFMVLFLLVLLLACLLIEFFQAGCGRRGGRFIL